MNATRLVRQHGLDGSPFIVGEFVAQRRDKELPFLLPGGPVAGAGDRKKCRTVACTETTAKVIGERQRQQ